jgi:hypothetical protein
MPWHDPQSVAFTRLEIAGRVPSASAVFGVLEGESCRYVGNTWNLKARLLELANLLPFHDNLRIVFELCPDAELAARSAELSAEFTSDLTNRDPAAGRTGVGITFWT